MTAELTYRRVHRAPRDLVFQCMTSPAHLARFWGPAGTTTPVDRITVDLRPGGAFETAMVNDSDGNEHVMRAVYTEVDPPERLAWREEGGMATTVTFADLGDDTTEVVIHQTNVPEFMLSPQAQAGFSTSLDKFDVYLAQLTGAEAPSER